MCSEAIVENTQVKLTSHHVALDGSDLPRLRDLTDKIAEWVVNYSIPRSAIAKAESEQNPTRKLLALKRQAKETFKTRGMSGEHGEMLMFVIAEAILGLPQLLCKMDLKTDPEVHFFGLDGVHCGPGPTTDSLAVYWCESKVYKDVGDAISDALGGLKPFLTGAGTGDKDKRRELALLNRYMDLGDPKLQELVLESLDPSNEKFNHVAWRGICFIGFETSLYPDAPKTKTKADLLSELTTELSKWKSSISTKVTNKDLQCFDIHFVLVPFALVEDFRNEMKKSLELDT